MSTDAHSPPPGEPLGAGLLIVTGASHTGKSSVIRLLLPELRPPVALLGVDDILEHTLVNPIGDRWAEIPLAYGLIQGQLEVLLDAGWLIVVESTFTYVLDTGSGSFHRAALEAMVGAADRRRARSVVCRLEVTTEVAARRAREDGRLDPVVVAETERLHRETDMPGTTRAISVDEMTEEEVAAAVRQRLPTSFLNPSRAACPPARRESPQR